jgi:hypothetical protein
MTLEQALASQAAAQQAAAGRGGASSSRGGGGAAAAAAATVTLAPTVMEASLNRMFEGRGTGGEYGAHFKVDCRVQGLGL